MRRPLLSSRKASLIEQRDPLQRESAKHVAKRTKVDKQSRFVAQPMPWNGPDQRNQMQRKALGSKSVLDHFMNQDASINDGYNEPPSTTTTTSSSSLLTRNELDNNMASFSREMESTVRARGGSHEFLMLRSGLTPDETHNPTLTLQQQQALTYVTSPASPNVFLTGSAGTGKSFLLRSIISSLRRINGPESVAVTAPTGIAATNLDGVTLHSWSGVGLGRADKAKLARSGEDELRSEELRMRALGEIQC